MKYKRVVIIRHGGPEVLQVVEEDVPEPSAEQVRIKIIATGAAFTDVLMREGMYPGVPPIPYAPGYDIVGIVDKLGTSVSNLELGQVVVALTIVGGYAEFICLPAEDVVLVHSGVDPIEACCLPLAYVTAYQMLIAASKKRHPDWLHEDLTQLLSLLTQRKIQPIISRKIPLVEATHAHELLNQSAISGKIVLLCNLGY